ncbi:hypothetical protein [Kribbella sp. CA-293567]|uniref:hypothetical protein n=1 Tax=Kribbella sp. CA-293567 TaxID=3002436 RepID=UPI0022DE95A8|nr:hypothetical protein [Kribbella sp. CA-293567]WBQ04819.1 hypothetical protein OX958_33280 [Kribbella sp. CA-293567]
MSRQLSHHQSHASLLRDVSAGSVPSTRSRLDAIVVPAARAVPQSAIDLSARLSVPLVILCSLQAKADNIADRVNKTFGAQALVVQVDDSHQLLSSASQLTSHQRFKELSAGRSSDLSVKRNLGLRLARLRGWRKILFVDDDISQIRTPQVDRLVGYLDSHPVVSMASREFPDNSVVCHARREAGFSQDVFVSGAVLGVNTQHPDFPYFPDVYNEDWFFFSRYAAQRSLAKIGEVRQDEYKPFADPLRAAREEFGDLLAEGLYALFESTQGLSFSEQLAAAGHSHWQRFSEARHEMITQTAEELEKLQATADATKYRRGLQALESLRYAEKYLQQITPADCVEFIQRWRADEHDWQYLMARSATGLSERDAFDELGLAQPIRCGYGSSSGSRKRAPFQPKLRAAGLVGQ